MDSAISAVDVFVGVGRREMLTVKEHPLVTMLKAATNNAGSDIPLTINEWDEWGDPRDPAARANPVWRLSGDRGDRAADDPGHLVQAPVLGGRRAWMAQHHYPSWVAYQPHSHLIWLELARNGILVAVAALAVLASVWWLRIRPAD